MESLIAQRERALFDVLVDDLAHWVSEMVPSSAAAAAESRSRSSSAASATGTGSASGTDAAAAATSCTAAATIASTGDRRSDFFDSIRDGRVLCALLAAISSQNAPTQTPTRGRSGSSAAASDFQARFVPR
jgi:hypothetical protein